MDLKDIQNLIKFVAKSGASEVKLEMEDVKSPLEPEREKNGNNVYPAARCDGSTTTLAAAAPVVAAPPTKEEAAAEENSKYITIKSPIIGTFYRKPAPDKPVFKEVGDTIGVGDVLCVIEAMKLFNEIESEVSGKIVKVLVDDSSPVEFDQPLFLVDPS